jgi:hypothetical protein
LRRPHRDVVLAAPEGAAQPSRLAVTSGRKITHMSVSTCLWSSFPVSGHSLEWGTGEDDCGTSLSYTALHNVPNRRSDTLPLREILPQFTELITKGGRIA